MPPKRAWGSKAKRPAEDGDDIVSASTVAKKNKATANGSASASTSTSYPSAKQKDDEGNAFWELSKTRRVTISTFKKQTYVNIREFYEADGQMRPGKKGIALNMEIFSGLVSLLPDLESVLAASGEEVPRPDYGGDGIKTEERAAKEEEGGGDEENGKDYIDVADEDDPQVKVE